MSSLPADWTAGNSAANSARREDRRREFPFFWIKKPNMASLQVLASHLKDKSLSFRNDWGFRGETTPMEKQIIERMTAMQQQMLLLTDVVQASLEILDDHRPSRIAKRSFRWIREKLEYCWQKVEQNIFYRILALVGVGATLWLIMKVLIGLVRK